MFDAEFQCRTGFQTGEAPAPRVESLAFSPTHSFTKAVRHELTLLQGLGVEGDAHCSPVDQHMGRRGPNPPPNLRQVHLFPGELMDLLPDEGFTLAPGLIGENVVTRGVDVVNLPLNTRFVFPSGAAVKLTGRRTPCRLVDRLGKGLMRRLMGDGKWGERPIAGVMAVVEAGGAVRAGEAFRIDLPDGLWGPLPAL